MRLYLLFARLISFLRFQLQNRLPVREDRPHVALLIERVEHETSDYEKKDHEVNWKSPRHYHLGRFGNIDKSLT